MVNSYMKATGANKNAACAYLWCSVCCLTYLHTYTCTRIAMHVNLHKLAATLFCCARVDALSIRRPKSRQQQTSAEHSQYYYWSMQYIPQRQEPSQTSYYGMRMRTVSHTVLQFCLMSLWSIGREETEFEEVEVIQFVLVSLESCYGLISVLLPCCPHTQALAHSCLHL